MTGDRLVRRSFRTIVLAVLVSSSLMLLAGRSRAPARAATPTPTPSGAVAFGKVLVVSGNALPRNSGQENQPPVWLTVDANGSTATVTIGNATRVPLDFSHTVVIDLGSDVRATAVLVSVGTAAIQGNQVVWNNFSLTSGQIAPALISLSVTAGGAQSGSGLPSIRSVSIDAKATQGGADVVEQADGGGPSLAALTTAGGPGTATTTAPPSTPVRGRSAAIDAWAVALLIGSLVALISLVGLVVWLYRRLQRLLQAMDSGRIERDLSGFVGRLEAATRVLAIPVVEQKWSGTAGSSVASSGPHQRTTDDGSGASAAAPPAPHGAALQARSGAEAGRVWLLDHDEVEIGRNLSNTIGIANPRVSRQHARILHLADGSYLLVDHRSTNGTTLNGHAVLGWATLQDGDAFDIGGVTFVFYADAASAGQSGSDADRPRDRERGEVMTS